MKTKLYTTEQYQKEGTDETLPTAAEFAVYAEKAYGIHFKTRKSLVQWYLKINGSKLPALDFLEKRAREKGYKSILSLGAGTCVMEYLLKKRLPGVSVTATDYNPFFIKNARRLFPEIKATCFDFIKERASCLKKIGKFDAIVFFGSSYVMDDEIFVRKLKDLAEGGAREIIDFQAGYIPLRKVPKTIISEIKWALLAKLRKNIYRGRFHGYSRTRGELRRLYEEAGLKIVKETSVGDYEHVAVCRKK